MTRITTTGLRKVKNSENKIETMNSEMCIKAIKENTNHKCHFFLNKQKESFPNMEESNTKKDCVLA